LDNSDDDEAIHHHILPPGLDEDDRSPSPPLVHRPPPGFDDPEDLNQPIVPDEHPPVPHHEQTHNPHNLAEPVLDHLKTAMDFVRSLHDETWEDADIPDLLRDLIDNPAELPELTPAERISLDIYLATAKAPWDVYESVRRVV
jgi:hypothetical protein